MRYIVVRRQRQRRIAGLHAPANFRDRYPVSSVVGAGSYDKVGAKLAAVLNQGGLNGHDRGN